MRISPAIQREAKALGDPSRFTIFQHIAAAPTPVGVAELTDLLGFNHNAIRQHLAVLVDTGLVHESTEIRTTPGRPRKQYVATPHALTAFCSTAGPYERLAELLLEAITSDEAPYDIGKKAAANLIEREDGPSRSARPDDPAETAVQQLMPRLRRDGFEPTQVGPDAIELGRCPFAAAATKNPAIVCELHRGLIDGQLAHHREPGTTATLTTKDPTAGGCVVRIG